MHINIEAKMKNLSRIVVILIVFIWLVPSVLAFGNVFDIEVNSNKNQERIYLGDYWETTYTITNNNLVCEITCDLPDGVRTNSLEPGTIFQGVVKIKASPNTGKRVWNCWATSQSWLCHKKETKTLEFISKYSYCGDKECDPEEDYNSCRKDCPNVDSASVDEAESGVINDLEEDKLDETGDLKESSEYEEEDRIEEEYDELYVECWDTTTIELENKEITISELNELVQQHEGTTIIIEGKNVNFVDYNFVLNEGRIKIVGEGIFSIETDEKVIINNIEITNDGWRETYYDSGEIEEIYLVFNNKKIDKNNIIEFEDNELYIKGFEDCAAEIEFKSGNNLMKIEENDKFIIYPSGGEVNIKNENGKTSVDIKGDINLENDEYSLFYINDENVKALAPTIFTQGETSVPMDIFYSSGDTNIKYEMDNNEKLTSYGKDVTTDKYEKDLPSVEIFKSDGEEQLLDLFGMDMVNYNEVIDLYYDLTPETREEISIIGYYEEVSEGAGGASKGDMIFIPYKNQYSSMVFSHEAAHVLHYALESKGSDFTLKWLKTALPDSIVKVVPMIYWIDTFITTEEGYDQEATYKAQEKYYELLDETLSLARNEAQEKKIRPNEEVILRSMISVHNDPGKYIIIGFNRQLYDEYIVVSERDAHIFGYVCPYGLYAYYEDVATMVQYINYDPEYVSSLIYQPEAKLMTENSIIKNKVKLLYEYNFISKEQYNELNR